MSIRFYAPKDPFGGFSNFSRHPVHFREVLWPTSEHAFQGMKYAHDPEYRERIRTAATPTVAASLGRDRNRPMTPDWEGPVPSSYTSYAASLPKVYDGIPRDTPVEHPVSRYKDWYMYAIVLAKMQQHPALKEMLLSTGDEPLIEAAIHDPYWGEGASRNGYNKLGRILMVIREQFRDQQ